MSQMFDALGQRPQQNQQQTQQQALQEIKSNPAAYLKKMGYNLPSGIDTRNPQAIINGLVQTGQIGNGRVQQLLRMFGGKF
jgi:membrane protease subunit (stomatin/prohibitin family)